MRVLVCLLLQLLLYLLPAPLAAAAPAASAYKVTLLPPDTFPTGINAKGHISGAYQFSTDSRAMIWANGVLTDLQVPGARSVANAINSSGQAVGAAQTAAGATRAFRYSGGQVELLGTLGGNYSNALSINDAGHIVGMSTNARGEQRGFLYADGQMRDLGTLGGSYVLVNDINNAGQIVGGSSPSGGWDNSHAFLYENGVMRDLGWLGAHTVATDINDAGRVTGTGDTGRGQHAFVYDGALLDLGTHGGQNSFAGGINEAGYVVGTAENETFAAQAFFFHDPARGLINLSRLVPLEPGWSFYPVDINRRDQIVALGVGGGGMRALLIDGAAPIPEPAAYALLLAGLALLAWKRRPDRRVVFIRS